MCPDRTERYSSSPEAAATGGNRRPEPADGSDPTDGAVLTDEAALVERFRERIRLFVARRFGSVASAEDVAQETLRRVLEAAREDRIRDPSALGSFVFQTARHVCLHEARSARRRDRALRRRGQRRPKGNALDDAVIRERREVVARALKELREGDRELLRMLFYEGLTTAEAAERLGVTSGALRVRKHRALKRLEAVLERQAPEAR